MVSANKKERKRILISDISEPFVFFRRTQVINFIRTKNIYLKNVPNLDKMYKTYILANFIDILLPFRLIFYVPFEKYYRTLSSPSAMIRHKSSESSPKNVYPDLSTKFIHTCMAFMYKIMSTIYKT